MNVKEISDNVRLQEWAVRIEEARNSGLSVRQWCKNNNISEQVYYYWLKRIRKLTVENTDPKFIPIQIDPVPVSNTVQSSVITITKGDIHLEFPDTVSPDKILDIIKVLLC